MEITDRLYGQLSKDDVKAVVTSKPKENSDDREELFNEFLDWLDEKNNG